MNYKTYFKKNPVKLSERQKIGIVMGGLITQARLRGGMTQAMLAKKIGTKQSSVARAEHGVVVPSILFLNKIAKATGGELILPKLKYRK